MTVVAAFQTIKLKLQKKLTRQSLTCESIVRMIAATIQPSCLLMSSDDGSEWYG